ncbi:hypothetical protein H0H93_014118 [Arthromyces matolae]|nr:hypothetical protein H0H93_014118 [Arthromyces matolae]
MYYDLNVPIPGSSQLSGASSSKKGKGKQQQTPNSLPAFSASEINEVEARIDLLIRFFGDSVQVGYTVFAFNQFVQKRVDQKSHVNTAEPLVKQLRKRAGIVYLRRLSIILDEDSEKGFGLVSIIKIHDKKLSRTLDSSRILPRMLNPHNAIAHNSTYNISAFDSASAVVLPQAYSDSNCIKKWSCLRNQLRRCLGW